MHYIWPNNHVLFSVCFHRRHTGMPFIMELSNQYHTILLPLLPPGSTLYLYFPSICSISDNRSLHLEHTLPETWAITTSFGGSLHADIPVAVKCHDYHLRQRCAERTCEEMMACNGWVAVKKWVMFSGHTHLSMKVIFTQRPSQSWVAVMVFMLLLVKQLGSLMDWMHVFLTVVTIIITCPISAASAVAFIDILDCSIVLVTYWRHTLETRPARALPAFAWTSFIGLSGKLRHKTMVFCAYSKLNFYVLLYRTKKREASLNNQIKTVYYFSI